MSNPWRLPQFFEDDVGRYSMTRLLCFLSFWPASYVIVVKGNEAMLGWYLSAYVLGYVGGKVSEQLGKPKSAPIHVDNVESVNVDSSPKQGVKNATSNKRVSK